MTHFIGFSVGQLEQCQKPNGICPGSFLEGNEGLGGDHYKLGRDMYDVQCLHAMALVQLGQFVAWKREVRGTLTKQIRIHTSLPSCHSFYPSCCVDMENVGKSSRLQYMQNLLPALLPVENMRVRVVSSASLPGN